MAPSSVSQRAVSAAVLSTYTRTARAISGWVLRMEYGVGNLDHQNSIRSQENLTAFSVLVKTTTAHSSSAGTVEFTVSSTAKRRRIQSPEERARSGREGCFAIGTVVCGSELTTKGLYTYTREGQ